MKTLSMVIPLYNEGGRIDKTIKILERGFDYNGLKLESLIFVDDGSTDSTVRKIVHNKEGLAKALKCPVKLITYNPNKGRGHAIRFATLLSRSDYVLYADGDMSIPLSNLKTVLPVISKNYDLIFGSKKKPGANAVIPRSLIRKLVGYGHSLIASIVLGVIVWDFQGGFKIFSKKLIREVFPYLTVDRWGFDMEIIFLAKKLGYKNLEIPVTWSHQEKDTKVKLVRDILRSLSEMTSIRYNWTFRNYSSQGIRKIPSVTYTVL